MNYFKPGLYRHFKGNYYLSIANVIHSEDETSFILYMPVVDKENKLWVRPAELFLSSVETDQGVVPRFTFLRDLNDEEMQQIQSQIFLHN